MGVSAENEGAPPTVLSTYAPDALIEARRASREAGESSATTTLNPPSDCGMPHVHTRVLDASRAASAAAASDIRSGADAPAARATVSGPKAS